MLKVWLRRALTFCRRLNAKWHLHYGVCPLCNSSPPAMDCYVCHGSYKYGIDLGDDEKQAWLDRYLDYLSFKKGPTWTRKRK